MFGFSFKKWFFDLWDNLFAVFMINVAFSLILAFPFVIPGLVYKVSPTLSTVLFITGILILSLAMACGSRYAWDMARGDRIEFSKLLPYLKASLLPGLVLGLVNVFMFYIVSTALPFYAAQSDFISIIGMGLVFWLVLFWLIISQYFLPLNAQIENRIPKLFKKSFILFMDNPGLSFLMGLVSLLIIAVSIFTLSLFPGFTGLLLWHQVCMKLVMYKYDYLELNPKTPRKNIPWEELLFEEKEKIGKRTLRNMIFPWKD